MRYIRNQLVASQRELLSLGPAAAFSALLSETSQHLRPAPERPLPVPLRRSCGFHLISASTIKRYQEDRPRRTALPQRAG